MHGLNRVITQDYSEVQFSILSDEFSNQSGETFFRLLPWFANLLHLSATDHLGSMAQDLGKRKRRDQVNDLGTTRESTAEDESSDLQALFRQHFESTFEPLPGSFAPPPLFPDLDTKASDEEPESDWDGFSEDGEDNTEAVHYAISTQSKVNVSKDEYKTFMVRAQIMVFH